MDLLTGGALSGTVGGSANVTSGGSLKLNGLSVKGHGSLNSGSISGSYSGGSLSLNVTGDAALSLWLAGALSGTVSGSATLTSGRDLNLRDLTVKGLAELIVNGALNGSFTGSDLLLNVTGDADLTTGIDRLEGTIGGSINLHNLRDLRIGGISGRYNGLTAGGDVNITVDGVLTLLEQVLSHGGTVNLLADAIYDADGNPLDEHGQPIPVDEPDTEPEPTATPEPEPLPEDNTGAQPPIGGAVAVGALLALLLWALRKKRKPAARQTKAGQPKAEQPKAEQAGQKKAQAKSGRKKG